MKLTAQQQAFVDAMTEGSGHVAMVARAGCGKTSTILEAVDALVAHDPRLEIGVCAYNKAIAEEVGTKLKLRGHTNWKTVQAATLHSMGFGLLRFMFKPTIDDKKVRKLIEQNNNPVAQAYGEQVGKLVGLAKQAAFGFFQDRGIRNASAWYELADHYDVNGFDDTSAIDEVVELAQEIYVQSLNQTDVVDFDDMILFPLIKNLRVKFGKDVLFLDEAQDLSPARQALARKFLKPHVGRMVIVGDDRQAIYGFAGADSEAMPNLIRSLNAKTMPLSVTWRCPKAVVREAQRFVKDIEAAPDAPEGEVLKTTKTEDIQTLLMSMTADDAILCRNVAPLITTAYKLIRAGIPCKVEGRNIGEGLTALVRRWKVKTIDGLYRKLDNYREREVQKAQAKGNEAKVQEIDDRVATIEEICKACVEQGKTQVLDVVEFIENLFADGAKNVTVLASYHRSKGREWPRVVLWEHSSRCPSRAARQPWQLQQEDNLAYVAITRAQQTLVFAG